MILIKGSKRPN